jgi:hypothetical protein
MEYFWVLFPVLYKLKCYRNINESIYFDSPEFSIAANVSIILENLIHQHW